MDHADHVRLLRDGVVAAASVVANLSPSTVRQGLDEIVVWADLGAGAGAFTLALAELLPAGAVIHAVDRDRGALAELERSYARFARRRAVARVTTQVGDFTGHLDLHDLDGVVMANSLHFVKEKDPVLASVRAMLRPGGRLLLVEYDTDRGNTWVPHPLSYESWRTLAFKNGFGEAELLATHPSRFLRQIYSASCTRLV